MGRRGRGGGGGADLVEGISDNFNVEFVQVGLRYAGLEIRTCDDDRGRSK